MSGGTFKKREVKRARLDDGLRRLRNAALRNRTKRKTHPAKSEQQKDREGASPWWLEN